MIMEQSDQSACCKYILGALLYHPVGFASKHAFSAPPFFDLRVSTNEAFDLNALTMAFCKSSASIPIKCFKVTHSGIFMRYEKI